MNFISQKVKWCVLSIVITLILGAVDWVTGYYLNFFVFYFIPVFFAAWFLGLLGSVFISILCSLVWFGADALTGHTHTSDVYAVWNTMIRLISFLAIGWSASALKHTLDIEKETSEKLRRSLSEIKVLQSFLPICSQCKKIRDENGIWQHIEAYISEHANTQFSHSYCPECYNRAMAEAGLLNQQDQTRK